MCDAAKCSCYCTVRTIESVNYALRRVLMTLRTLQPHLAIHEIITTGQLVPVEQVTCSVDSCISAVVVPESTTMRLCTAGSDVSIWCGEHVAVVLTERVVVDVAWEPGDRQLIVVRLVGHDERAVLGPEPRSRALLLHVEPQLALTVLAQLMNLLVAQPEVAARIAKPNSKLIPRSVEETRVVDVLLNQYGLLSAEVCNKVIRPQTESCVRIM